MSRFLSVPQVSLLAVGLIGIAVSLRAQPSVTTYAQGLTRPMGMEIDGRGRLWVAQQGTGLDDSQIAVVTTDGQVHAFMDSLPSARNPVGDVTGSNGVYFDGAGNVVIVEGQGPRTLSASILFVDTTGFKPGDPPLTPAAVHTVYDIDSFLAGQGFLERNPFSLAFAPNGDMFLTDAAANALVRREAETGEFNVLVTFSKIPNNTGIGEVTTDAVPTGVIFADNILYVTLLTGFPFGDGAARVYQVDQNGDTSTFRTGLTTLVDIDIDPRDGELVVLQHAAYKPPPPFVENSGAVYKLRKDGSSELMVSGLNRPSAMRFGPSGELFISLVVDGEIVKVEGMATSREPDELPGTTLHAVAYPNPLSSQTVIGYELPVNGRVVITISDILGREIRTLSDAVETAGAHQALWDARDGTGMPVSSGMYLYRIAFEKEAASGTIHVVR